MIILIDNYDSFSYNLYQLIGSLNPEIKVVRNDEITVEEILSLNPSHIVISPGPGKPSDAGICVKSATYFSGKIPLLGVCLGHQAICEAFGATVTYAEYLMHGKTSIIEIDNTSPLFLNMNKNIQVARYHSLAADPKTIPKNLIVTAKTEFNEVMAVKHKTYDIYGVQFHPESIMTPNGKQIIINFLNLKK